MNKVLGLSFIIVIIALLLNTNFSAQKTIAQPSFKTFDSLGINIQYPSDWLELPSPYGALFISPNVSTSDLDVARILVENPVDVSNLPTDQIMSNIGFVYGLKPIFQMIDFQRISLPMYDDAYYMVYNFNDPNFGETSGFDVFLFKNNILSIIHYNAPPTIFDTYLDIYSEMLPTYSTTILPSQPPGQPVTTPSQPENNCFNLDLDLSDILLDCARARGDTINPDTAGVFADMLESEHQSSMGIINNMQ